MIITFFGHSEIYDVGCIYKNVKKAIIENTKNIDKIIFYCGGYGAFDSLCARACRSMCDFRTDCEVVFVSPYISQSHKSKIENIMDTKLYDSILYPPLENVPLKFAISKRNEWMANQADLIIAYVEYTYGGAYKALEYAKKKEKHIINLAK